MISGFQHQCYFRSDHPAASVTSLRAIRPPATNSPAFRDRMRRVGDTLQNAGVRGIFLLHGTFVGVDSWGVIREIARVVPSIGGQLRRITKRLIDHLADDVGNYTAEFARLLESSLNGAGEPRIPVKLLYWSGENHHIGRADGAIRVLKALADEEPGGRWLLWGHSHGGNVLALTTNLLGAEESQVREFFRAARAYYQWPILGTTDLPIWGDVQQRLAAGRESWRHRQLDIVTFGTPVRYAWHPAGHSRLLHVIHHRELPGEGPPPPLFPPTLDDLRHAARGDAVQLLGIAGTNFTPAWWSWRAGWADRRLNQFLQPGLKKRDLVRRLRSCRRAHDAGENVLVEYGSVAGHIGQHLAGHAIYTRQEWLLFHAELIARRLYGMGREPDNEGSSPEKPIQDGE